MHLHLVCTERSIIDLRPVEKGNMLTALPPCPACCCRFSTVTPY